MPAINPNTETLHRIMNVVQTKLIFDKDWKQSDREDYFEWLKGSRPLHRFAFLTFAEDEGFIRMVANSPRIKSTFWSKQFPGPWTYAEHALQTGGMTLHVVRASNNQLVAANLAAKHAIDLVKYANENAAQ